MGNGEKQVGRESDSVTSSSPCLSKKSMTSRNKDSDQIKNVQGRSGSLVSGNLINSKTIPA